MHLKCRSVGYNATIEKRPSKPNFNSSACSDFLKLLLKSTLHKSILNVNLNNRLEKSTKSN